MPIFALSFSLWVLVRLTSSMRARRSSLCCLSFSISSRQEDFLMMLLAGWCVWLVFWLLVGPTSVGPIPWCFFSRSRYSPLVPKVGSLFSFNSLRTYSAFIVSICCSFLLTGLMVPFSVIKGMWVINRQVNERHASLTLQQSTCNRLIMAGWFLLCLLGCSVWGLSSGRSSIGTSSCS